MGFIELLLTAVGLAMDAFAVSICKGLGMRKMRYGQAVVIGLYFGVFQALMPLIGWLLGTSFSRYIQAFDHWIAFVLLALIGGKMLWDVFHEDDEATAAQKLDAKLDHRELFMLAIATSIDALAVGIAFACLDVEIWSSVSIIGIVTFVISFCGVWIGNRFGSRFEKKAGIAGGIVLIGIGVKILADHLIHNQ
ncbi:manganese efflux pump MntP family protein [Ruminococcus sp.]|uniref:manganese efflux pump MntP n=1 Tax=Ruminococcus sp. TaxID=41978 RepID=UPI0025D597B8|nr:manganese efflux pump MntP family protein [Ruminococcus sp.]